MKTLDSIKAGDKVVVRKHPTFKVGEVLTITLVEPCNESAGGKSCNKKDCTMLSVHFEGWDHKQGPSHFWCLERKLFKIFKPKLKPKPKSSKSRLEDIIL